MISFGGHSIKAFGAYIRTDLSGLQTIAGQGSNVIGIVGLAEKGPVNKAVTLNSSSDLINTFGSGPLVIHGLAAYVGGASTIVAVRLAGATGATLTAMNASPGSTEAYEWRARELGTLGNNIMVSVETDDMGTTGPGETDDDLYVIRVKYVDAQGNDIRESFVVPRYIPNRAGHYFNNNVSGDYYLLRNRDTGTIREVPRTWGFNNPDVDAFLNKVEDMKPTNEDLIGPFPHGAGTNAFPLALVASVVNYGGLEQAPSSLVTLEGADPGMEEILTPGYVYNPNGPTVEELIAHPFVQLGGGYNGSDGTNYYGTYDDVTHTMDWDMDYNIPGSPVMDVWDQGLEVFEDEEVNFIQLAYLFNNKGTSEVWDNRYGYFKALMPKLIAHINTMSNIPNRKFRTSVVGIPYYRMGAQEGASANDFLDAIQDITGTVNNDRIQLWAGGFSSNAFSNGVMQYGGELLASFVVGAQAAREVATSLTFAQLSGIFTHGLEFAFNTAQKDELYTRRHAFVMRRRTATGALEHVAAHNYTSFTGAPNRGMALMITRRIIDYLSSTIVKSLEETFVGRKSRGAETAANIAEYVDAILQRMVREDVIVAYADIQVEADPLDKTVYNVTYKVQPVTEIDFITVTQHLTYQLA